MAAQCSTTAQERVGGWAGPLAACSAPGVPPQACCCACPVRNTWPAAVSYVQRVADSPVHHFTWSPLLCARPGCTAFASQLRLATWCCSAPSPARLPRRRPGLRHGGACVSRGGAGHKEATAYADHGCARQRGPAAEEAQQTARRPAARTRPSGVDSWFGAHSFLALCAAADSGLSEESSALHALFLRELELYEFQARPRLPRHCARCRLTAGAARAAFAHRHGEQRQRARAGELCPAAGAAGGVHGAGTRVTLPEARAGGRSRCCAAGAVGH